MQIDGNALRAARREALGEPVTYTLGDAEVAFPVEMPLSAADITREAIEGKWEDERYLRAVLLDVLGEDAWNRLWAQRPSLGDLVDLWRALNAAYGVEQGESHSSPDSSATGGERSKPSSKRSTKKTRATTSSPDGAVSAA